LAETVHRQGLYSLGNITNEGNAIRVERRAGPAGGTGHESDWRAAWLNMEAPAVSRPFVIPGGQAKGVLTVQADARLARDTLWQGG
ncbi:hypothetical protein LLE87_35460, partial [Paenibacillus polymyxa]|nr:hypothetical protein [Paenibacillus polymyxa]